MPADDRLWAENCNRAEDGREPTIEPNKQKSIVLLSCGRLDTCRRSTMSCWRRIRISVRRFVLGLKSEAMIWRISRSNSIIKWQGYRVSASRLAESKFSVHTGWPRDVRTVISFRRGDQAVCKRSRSGTSQLPASLNGTDLGAVRRTCSRRTTLKSAGGISQSWIHLYSMLPLGAW